MRVFTRDWESWVVQYGVWRTRNFSPRFYLYREWPCGTKAEAEVLKRSLEVELGRNPDWMPPPDEEPKLDFGGRVKR